MWTTKTKKATFAVVRLCADNVALTGASEQEAASADGVFDVLKSRPGPFDELLAAGAAQTFHRL